MQISVLFTLLVCISQLQTAQGDSILFFFPGNSYSHKVSIWPLVTALSERGHNVTFLSPHEKQPYKNTKINDVAPQALIDVMVNQLRPDRQSAVTTNTESDLWLKLTEWTVKVCEVVLNSPYDKEPTLYNISHENSYDLIIINAAIAECGFMLAHRKKSKYVISDATTLFPWHPDIYGMPTESSWIPSLISPYRYPMSFLNRVENYVVSMKFAYFKYTSMYPKLEQFLQENSPEETIPSILDMERNASLLLMNSHFTTDFARSLPPMVIQIGGMSCWGKSEEIPKDMNIFIEEAQDGAILIAFGSTFDTKEISTTLLSTFFAMMEQFPKIHFIWKWEEDIPKESRPKNLLVSKWLPQKGILEHPKTLAFISHCGMNSIQEATFFGVPVIAFPLFGDQFYNAYRIEIEKIGIRLESRQNINTPMLIDAVQEMTSNLEYRDNMRRMSKMFRDRPATPVESATYWIEYTLRHENLSPLHPKNADLNWLERRDLDVVLFIVFFILAIPIFIAYILKKVASRFLRKT